MNKLLTIDNLHLGYGNEEILFINELTIEQNSIVGFLGPSGGGKSSFMNAILRYNSSPSYWEKGNVYLENKPLDRILAKQFVTCVPQKSRLYTGTIFENFVDGLNFKVNMTEKDINLLVKKMFMALDLWEMFSGILDDLAIKHSMGIHKILLIAKAVILKPKLLLLDEVLASTSVKDEVIIIDLIKKLKKFTTVLLITHNKDEAKELCDSIALVSGGLLHEHTKNKQFFKLPKTDIGKEFLESGSAWYTNPDNDQQNHDLPEEDNLTALRRFSSICEFYWVLTDKLGGMQKPGLMTEIEDDLKIMKQLGVNVLVTLQQNPIDITLLNKYSIEGIHFPIIDMDVPDLEKTYQFILKIQSLYEKGNSLVYHCKAGMGRTGTLLACNLLWIEKLSAIKAIERIRQVNYKYIQTDEQMDFVSQFESHVKQKMPI